MRSSGDRSERVRVRQCPIGEDVPYCMTRRLQAWGNPGGPVATARIGLGAHQDQRCAGKMRLQSGEAGPEARLGGCSGLGGPQQSAPLLSQVEIADAGLDKRDAQGRLAILGRDTAGGIAAHVHQQADAVSSQQLQQRGQGCRE